MSKGLIDLGSACSTLVGKLWPATRPGSSPTHGHEKWIALRRITRAFPTVARTVQELPDTLDGIERIEVDREKFEDWADTQEPLAALPLKHHLSAVECVSHQAHGEFLTPDDWGAMLEHDVRRQSTSDRKLWDELAARHSEPTPPPNADEATACAVRRDRQRRLDYEFNKERKGAEGSTARPSPEWQHAERKLFDAHVANKLTIIGRQSQAQPHEVRVAIPSEYFREPNVSLWNDNSIGIFPETDWRDLVLLTPEFASVFEIERPKQEKRAATQSDEKDFGEWWRAEKERAGASPTRDQAEAWGEECGINRKSMRDLYGARPDRRRPGDTPSTLKSEARKQKVDESAKS